MSKKYARTAFAYAILAMVFGVFYREFTKIMGFTGSTRLSVLHTHAFLLGMLFFLIVLAMEKLFGTSQQKMSRWFYISYNAGLLITLAAFFTRGLLQVTTPELSSALDASISGIAGVGHVLLSVGMVLFFISLTKQINKESLSAS